MVEKGLHIACSLLSTKTAKNSVR